MVMDKIHTTYSTCMCTYTHRTCGEKKAQYALEAKLVWPSLVQLLGSCQEVLRWFLRSFSQEVCAEATNVQGFVPVNLREHVERSAH